MTDKNKQVNYHALNAELETILADLQAGDLEIDEAVEKYQRGMEIVEQIQTYLKEAENKVKKVKTGR